MTRYMMATLAFNEVQDTYYYINRLGYNDLFTQLQEISAEILRRRNEEADADNL